MHYVYLTNSVVTDQCQVDPYSIFSESYASQFIEAPDEVTFGWSLVDGSWTPPPAPPAPTPEEMQAANKAQAESLLQATDWTATVDINDPQYSNPYLGNQPEFLAYRSDVRKIAVNPPVTVDVWPTKPDEVWVTVPAN